MNSFKLKKSKVTHHEHSPILNKKKDQSVELQVLEILKKNSLSITAPRKIILKLLITKHGPFTAEEIFQQLPKNSCDQATVYRCLNQFLECQIVSSSFLTKDLAHYEFNDPHHHHHHIICKICKKIESLHDCLLEKIESNLEKRGYSQIQHRLEFFAVCAQCTTKEVL
jgi:Fur family ferric uptake transcriptional regulator